jgi:hypothetical protein
MIWPDGHVSDEKFEKIYTWIPAHNNKRQYAFIGCIYPEHRIFQTTFYRHDDYFAIPNEEVMMLRWLKNHDRFDTIRLVSRDREYIGDLTWEVFISNLEDNAPGNKFMNNKFVPTCLV